MLIHVHCAGSMTEGLDSPSRGEGRWAQNIVKVLAKQGHTIVATGGGLPSWGSTKKVDNVYLVPESSPIYGFDGHDIFDLSMDPTWWKDKKPMVKAKKYLVMKWSLEDYTRSEPLPDNQYLCYPLNIHTPQFFEDRCVNKDRSFFLPLPLGEKFREPNFDADGILWTCKDVDREKFMRDNARMMMDKVLYPLLEKDNDLFVIWLMADMMSNVGLEPKIRPDVDLPFCGLIPYYRVRELLSACRLVMAVNIPGSVLDATSLGVPTLEWEVGGFFNHIGRKHNVLIEKDATVERIQEVVNKFLYNKDFYCGYVKDIQEELKFNTNSYSLECFNNIVKKIF